MGTTPQARRQKDWDPEDIKAAVRKKKRGTTLASLSRDHNYAPLACSMALRQPWPAVEAIIADFLGEKPWDIWPSRYHNRKPKTRPWRRHDESAQ